MEYPYDVARLVAAPQLPAGSHVPQGIPAHALGHLGVEPRQLYVARLTYVEIGNCPRSVLWLVGKITPSDDGADLVVDERFLHGEALRSAEHRVLEDVEVFLPYTA